MYPCYDMNPIAIEHMRRERLAADVRHADHLGTNIPFRVGVTTMAILLVVAIVI